MGNGREFIDKVDAIAEAQSSFGIVIGSISRDDRLGLKEEIEQRQRGGVVTLDVVKNVWDAHITDLKKSLPYKMLKDEWQLDYHKINGIDFGNSSQGLKLKSSAMRLLKDRYNFFVQVDNLSVNKDLVSLIDKNEPVYSSDLKSSLKVFSSLEQDAERYLRREYLLRKEIETFLA